MIALANAAGTIVCSYGYDAWGVPVTRSGSMAGSGTVGFIQPFRYRGYVWDEETGLYYLRSRYYRPSWGRFVSADELVASNLYSYCKNNAVNLIDTNGMKSGTIWKRMWEFFIGDGPCTHAHRSPDCREPGIPRNTDASHSNQDFSDTKPSNGTVTYTVPGTGQPVTIPEDVYNQVVSITSHNGEPTLGYFGGGNYKNNPSISESELLPSDYAPFYEYDVHMPITTDGRRIRDLERLVFGVGGDGGIWYTQNHYASFLRIY